MDISSEIVKITCLFKGPHIYRFTGKGTSHDVLVYKELEGRRLVGQLYREPKN